MLSASFKWAPIVSGEIKMLVIEKMDTFSLEGNHFSLTQDAEQFSVSPKKINLNQNSAILFRFSS